MEGGVPCHDLARTLQFSNPAVRNGAAGADLAIMIDVNEVVRAVLRDVLGISAERTAAFGPSTGLFGSLPEFDSIAVMNVLTELEDRLGILIEDDEVDGDMLATFGALTDFAAGKAPR